MLNTLRWATEIRPADELELPAAGKSAANLKESELKMASQLIKDLTNKWKPDAYADKFTDAIHALIAKKAKAGKTEKVEPFEEAPEGQAESNVVDLTELLKRSLGKGKAASEATPRKTAARAAAKRPARKRA
jgi:DNA end-binding protein Ku